MKRELIKISEFQRRHWVQLRVQKCLARYSDRSCSRAFLLLMTVRA